MISTRRRGSRAARAAAIAAMLATGCVTGHAAAHQAARAQPPSAWQQTLGQVRGNGTVTTATALAAFDLAIGPVPGARPPAGPKRVIASGTIAVQWVFGHWRALTRSQRRAVLADLGLPTGPASGGVAKTPPSGRPVASRQAAPGPPAAGGSAVVPDALLMSMDLAGRPAAPVAPAPVSPHIPCLTADSAGAGPYRAQVAAIEHDIAAHVGAGPFSPDVYVSLNTNPRLEDGALLYTYGCTGAQITPSGPVRGCTIHVRPHRGRRPLPGQRRSGLPDSRTHPLLRIPAPGRRDLRPAEVVRRGRGDLGDDRARRREQCGERILAGLPRHAGHAAVRADLLRARLLRAPGGDRHRRVAQDAPCRPRDHSRGNAAGWRAAAPGQQFLDSWASGYAQGRYPGTAWQTGGPNLPHYEGPIPQASVGNGQTITVRAAAAATAISHVDLNAQVVTFAGTASGRLSLGGGADATLAQAAGATYVTAGTPARCPAGSPDAGARLTRISSGMHYVAVTGGLHPAAVSVQGLSLAAFCATTTVSCLVGSWATTRFQAADPGLFAEHAAAGTRMRIGPDGAMTVGFGPMAPIVFTGSAGSAAPISGAFTFGGRVTGRVRLPAGQPGATTGTWQPAVGGKIDYSSLTVTVHITSPIQQTIGPLSVSQLAGSLGAGGSSVNGHPLSGGTWQCAGNTLINRPPPASPADGTWTWTRTG